MHVRNTILNTILGLLLLTPTLQAKEYRVQLAAIVEKVPFTHFAFAGVNNIYMNTDQNNIYRYFLSTSFFERNDAEIAKKELIRRGFHHAQVVDMDEQSFLCGTPCPYMTTTTTFSSSNTENLMIEQIFFDFDRSALRYADTKVLDELYEMMVKFPQLKARILGHTDSKGSATYNVNLSKRRARAVRSYLISKGIPAYRLDALVFGESSPVSANTDQEGNDSPAGRKYNRRVVIALYDKQGEIISLSALKVKAKTAPPQLERARRKG